MAETNGEGLAKCWNDWRSSQEGTRCCDFSTISDGHYLENRLWRAFMAGAAAPSLPSAEELITLQLKHETLYRDSGGDWHWECKCGVYATLENWEACHRKTREHWADMILAALSSDKVSKEGK